MPVILQKKYLSVEMLVFEQAEKLLLQLAERLVSVGEKAGASVHGNGGVLVGRNNIVSQFSYGKMLLFLQMEMLLHLIVS